MILRSKIVGILLPIVIMLFLAQIEVLASNKFELPQRWKDNDFMIFNTMLNLEIQYKPQDIGQGWPLFKPPKILTDALVNATLNEDYSLSQYSSAYGLPRLVNAVAKYYSKQFNRALDPTDNVIVTIGATGALYTTFQAHTSPGDEWILIEPAYEYFGPKIKAAGGVPKFVSLKPKNNLGNKNLLSSDWTFDKNELERAFNNKTKGIVLNTPQNPIGKVFTLDELKCIAYLAKKWNTLVISDEIYSLLIYDQNKHISVASLPGMFERTITVMSAGKAFSATGYRIGWAIGGKKILENLKSIQAYMIIAPPTPLQEAFAVALENEVVNAETQKSYFHEFRITAESKRDRLVKSLRDFGLDVVTPDGGYFIMGNCTSIANKVDLRNETDSRLSVRFANWMIKKVGVFVYPLTLFNDKFFNKCTVRFSMIKTETILDKAQYLLHKWKQQNKNPVYNLPSGYYI